ncbi:thiol:disulfide interchange protein DsbD [Oceanisphaera litoralis]|uniref:protein-disulfide reductase DsbD domain-containing protein n=1 Tax=Oceanisphaera litoralis TaxID=225144 RepID=UPI00195E5819|nr:protein-disulfide reductase DsbD domain-containing protein [Oceanisphaera litoralis]MBM7455683.1 thiol:disulfide interchange protein DsbD [Oceanisphaera litoralis]
MLRIPLLLLTSALMSLPSQAGVLEWLGLRPEPAASGSSFLPVEQAFVLSSRQTPSGLLLEFTIAPGYYLYRQRLSVSPHNTRFGDWELPAGTPHEDEYFGKSQVYYQRLELTIPLQQVAPDGRAELRYQGCTSGLCYAPQQISIPLVPALMGRNGLDG